LDVWRDKEGIVTCTAWSASIENALRDAKCVVVLCSEHALASHFVRDEAAIGRNANELVPVEIGEVEPPIGYRGIQTANLVGWTGDVEHPEHRKLAAPSSIGSAPAIPTAGRRCRRGRGGGAR